MAFELLITDFGPSNHGIVTQAVKKYVLLNKSVCFNVFTSYITSHCERFTPTGKYCLLPQDCSSVVLNITHDDRTVEILPPALFKGMLFYFIIYFYYY